MKKMAFLLCIIFTTVQLVPVLKAFYPDTKSVFIADEEKGQEKENTTDNKEKKDYTDFLPLSTTLTHKVNTAFHLAEKVHLSPCLEKLTPPPNFC